jgi:hypothetical protein
MFFFRLGVDQNVVHENHNKLIQVLHKHVIHEVHEIGVGIHMLEGHHSVVTESILGAERCLGHI